MVALYPFAKNGIEGAVIPSVASDDTLLWQSAPGEHSVSVIVPTRNEAGNIGPLLARIETALAGQEVEVIFVDDSDDDTPAAIAREGDKMPFAVNVIARPPARRTGLGSAVVEGMRIAHHQWICVMDGDLQHPPEVIPQLLAEAESKGSDLAMASRLTQGAHASGLSLPRKAISQALALASRLSFPRRLGHLTDPLTGFFAVRRAAIDPGRLQPDGFKILLEVLIRHPELSVVEVPFTFGERHSGQSKANTHEVLRLCRHMLKLRLASQQALWRFLAVGLSGIVVNSILLLAFTEIFSLYFLLGAVLATQGSTLWNFLGSERWAFAGRAETQPVWQRALGFFALNNSMLLLRGPMLVVLTSWIGIHYLLANLFTLVFMAFLRFAIADRLIWRRNNNVMEDEMFHYHYNIHDILRVRSSHRLPELGYFQVGDALPEADLDVRVVSRPGTFRRDDSISYTESPGRFGFNIVINRGEAATAVFASPLIGRSPHVLYTNVVEPLIRWLLVERGYALMHGATIAFDEKAVFITARTDTGKTTTILHTMRNNPEHGAFLSDDMTIFRRDGLALNYPKPLTISHHTLQAIGGAPLTWKARAFLQIQSRLHSRSGRRAGMVLSKSYAPGATLNAIVQMLIPPPKFMVHTLIPGARYAQQARLAQLVVIERGDDGETRLNETEIVETLLANAEDAYGFPPYPHLAHRLSEHNGRDLQALEKEIVCAAVAGLPATHLRSSHYDWYARLPQLVGNYQENAGAQATAPATRGGLLLPVAPAATATD